MKSLFRNISFVISLSMICSLLSGFTSEINVENEAVSIARDDKIFCTATIDQEFDDSSVIVIMDNVAGGINKQHNLDFFGDIGALSVKDLTAMPSKIIEDDVSLAREASNIDDIVETANTSFELNLETFRQILKIELPIHSKENVLSVIKQLEKIEGIKYAGPNYISRLCYEPNDYSSNKKWEFSPEIMNTLDAWDITTGSHNVKVGVMDTGVAGHNDLVDNLVSGANFIGTTGTSDSHENGHGTHVAGIIGAVGDNRTGYVGVCFNVSIVPLKVFAIDSGGKMHATDDALIYAITYAIENDIHILNFSGGKYSASSGVAQAIVNYPGLFVTSSGNDYNNVDSKPHYPSHYSTVFSNVISVGNSDENDSIHRDPVVGDDIENDGSNYGANSVDLFAPGTNIWSTVPLFPDTDTTNYAKLTGTSMAAPQVSGAAALIMSVRPDMTPEQVKKCIMDSVDKSDAFEGKCVSGGRLNVYKAVQLATQPQTFTGDVNGDGRADMIVTRRQTNGNRAIDTYFGLSNGTFGAPVTQNFSQSYNYQDPVFLGDVNGDSKPDLIVHSTVSGKRSLIVYCGNYEEYNINNYQIPFANARQSTTNDSFDYYTARVKFFITDANGDGRDDFIVHTRNSSGKRINLTYLGLSTGSLSTTASTFTSTNNHGTSPVLIGDFNGDGMADMVVPHKNSSGKRCLLVYKGKSSAPYFAAGVKFNSSRNHDPLQWPCQYFVNDVNGDGKDDLIVHWKNANGKRNNLVYKGGSSGLTTEAVASAATSDDYVASDPIFVGDINGDGFGDMLVQWANSNNQRNLLVYKRASGVTYGTGENYNVLDTLDLPERPSCFFLADANGDGKMDFIVKYRSGSVVAFITYVASSNGSFGAGVYSNIYSEPPYFNN